MHKFVVAASLLIVAVPGVAEAQVGRAAVLRGRIEEVFVRRTKDELGLTDDQATRMGRVLTTHAERRGALENDERVARQALAAQLRPGVAANGDSVSRLVDRISNARVGYVESFRDEMRELTPILAPAQRGQYLIMRDRLLERVREMQQQRGAGAPGMRPKP